MGVAEAFLDPAALTGMSLAVAMVRRNTCGENRRVASRSAMIVVLCVGRVECGLKVMWSRDGKDRDTKGNEATSDHR